MPERHERHGWAYDADWAYFVHDGSTTQQVVLREAAVRDPDWAAEVGLDRESVEWLIAHPTPGAYRR